MSRRGCGSFALEQFQNSESVESIKLKGLAELIATELRYYQLLDTIHEDYFFSIRMIEVILYCPKQAGDAFPL